MRRSATRRETHVRGGNPCFEVEVDGLMEVANMPPTVLINRGRKKSLNSDSREGVLSLFRCSSGLLRNS